MDYSAMEQYWIWLSSVEGIGSKRFYQLLSLYEDARSVWDAMGGILTPPDIRAALGPGTLENLRAARDEGYFYRLFDRLEQGGIRALTRLSAGYPPALTGIYDPPPTLYVRGECPLDGERMIAVVGSRRCTRDGQRAAREFGRGLAENGVVVVSGMARGIDTCAHRGALEAEGGRTVAVLGCGVDVVYPPENDRLMAEILDTGGAIVSEFQPGMPPAPGNFPARNRIISGMSDGTLLVEGAKASGAMITVNLALEQGRDVFAVPGGIYSPMSSAPNRMILEGATPVLCHWDILEHYRWAHRPQAEKAQRPRQLDLEPDERAIVTPLREQELSFDELAAATGFSAAKLNSHLTMLELRGIIEKVPGGMYRAY